MSPSCAWAATAVSGYMREDHRPRVVVPLLVGEAWVLDQHDDAACRHFGIDRAASDVSWRSALTAETEPPSWRNADAARAAGADGLIDRSRMIPGGWHLILFRWNEFGGPRVAVDGEATEIRLSDGGPKWGL